MSAQAGKLDSGVLAVETHRKRIIEKLPLRSTADLILFAVRRGYVS